MSLVGNLEDLSLPDILQIVSLSRKSGILLLEREGQQGKIIIREGKVIQTVSPRQGKTLGELLTTRGLLRPDDLTRALEIQRSGKFRDLLGGILVQQKLIDLETLEKVVTEQIEDAIVFFLTWREGTFSFELAEIKGRGEFSVDPQSFILERGIDTQWLVLEGTRLIDERGRTGGAAPVADKGVTEPAGETSFAGLEDEVEEAVPAGIAVVLVDDDALFREMARDQLERLGFRVVPCETGAAGLAAVEREAGRAPLAVVTDIVMPTLDSQGFLGGLELLEKLRQAYPAVPVAAVTAYPDDNVKAQVLALGGQFLLKPGSGDAGGDEAFFSSLAAMLDAEGAVAPAFEAQPASAAPLPVPSEPEPVAPVPEPVPEPAFEAPALPVPPATPARAVEQLPAPVMPSEPALAAAPPRPAGVAAPARSDRDRAIDALAATRAAFARQESAIAAANLPPAEMALLRDMNNELQNPRATSEIGLLILRFAAELLNRAVLFVIKGGNATGLGGFGVEGRGVRGITVPLDEPSVLEAVVRQRATVLGTLEQSAWNRSLLEQLGGKTPVESVALPLVSGGKVRVVLYGDNLPEARPIAGTRALELFLKQAGLTLEKVLLEKKIQELETGVAAAGGRREQQAGGGGA